MATHRGFIPGYIGSPPVTPSRQPAQTEAERLANIAAIGERNRRLQEQRAELEAAKIKAQAAAEAAKRAAAFSLHQSQTNAAWNAMLAKQAQASKKPTISLEEDTPLGKVKRSLTPAEYEHALAVKDYTSKLDLLNSERTTQQGRVFPGGRQVAEIDRDIAALNPPADLLSGSSDLVSRPAVAAPAAAPVIQPTPMGIIGTPERNSFIAESTPLGMNRAQANDWAIGANTPATEAYAPPRDLLSAPTFTPTIGDLRVAESNIGQSAPIPQDAPMAPYKGIPASHIKHLLANPDTADDFNRKYGAGEADQYLNPVADEP